jgi:RNA polymerase sigma factor (sigma-70 family)
MANTHNDPISRSDSNQTTSLSFELYEWLVNREASRYFQLLPGSRDDLLQECRIGLLHAIEMFDPQSGYPFVAYASVVIANAARQFMSTESRKGIRGKSIDTKNIPLRLATVAPDSGGRKPLLDLIPDDSQKEMMWDKKKWNTVYNNLTKVQEQVLRLRLFEDMTYREIGEELGFRESRASHLFQEAIHRLRDISRILEDI